MSVEPQKKILAVFDFDGTITNRDTFIGFIRYVVGEREFKKKLWKLSGIITGYYLGLISNARLKEEFLWTYVRTMNEEAFRKTGNDFALQEIPKTIRKDAMERINQHKKEGHEVVIISASMGEWIEGWCIQQDVPLIANELEFRNGYLTGRTRQKNCYGAEKVKRLKDFTDLSVYSEIWAYGDSGGDKALLKVADKRFYRYFKG